MGTYSSKDKEINKNPIDTNEDEKEYENGHHPNSRANLKPFEKGISGNPSGKMSHAKLRKMLKEIGNEVVLDYYGKELGTRKDLVLKSIWDKAIKGNNIKYVQLLIWLGVLDD